jgi:hypothetical protein
MSRSSTREFTEAMPAARSDFIASSYGATSPRAGTSNRSATGCSEARPRDLERIHVSVKSDEGAGGVC